MNPRFVRAAWVAVVVMLAGWIFAVLGLSGSEEAPHIVPALRTAVRFFGFCLIVVGATMGAITTIGGPAVVIVAGAGLNLAFQAGLIPYAINGIAGAGMVLLGALWASRKIRKPPVAS